MVSWKIVLQVQKPFERKTDKMFFKSKNILQLASIKLNYAKIQGLKPREKEKQSSLELKQVKMKIDYK